MGGGRTVSDSRPLAYRPLAYRPGVDGLRAVAVAAVVVFHAAPGLLPGGYLGVDVFFVISGFLITSILHAALSDTERQARRHLAEFWGRRARRLLPALIPVLLFVTVASALLLPREFFRPTASSVLWSLAFAANWFFAGRTDYFGPAAEDMPLVHLWSLGVEEQFYLVFPLLLWAAFRLGGRRAGAALVAAATLLGFAASAWWSATDPQLAFYSTPSRVWQLGAGASLALAPAMFGWARTRHACALGLVLIAAGLALGRVWPAPVPAALLPTLGALLVVASTDSPARTVAGRALASPALVWLGKRSYGLYLWHWPLLVFGGLLVPQLGAAGDAAAIALAVGLAELSYRWLEQPVRTRGVLRGAVSGLAATAVAAGGTAWAAASSEAVLRPLSAFHDYEPELIRTRAAAFKAAGIRECWVSDPEAARAAVGTCTALDPERPDVLVAGDSHSAQFHAQMGAVFPDTAFSLVAANSCAFVEMPLARQNETCGVILDYLLGPGATAGFDALVLAPRVTPERAGEYADAVAEIADRWDAPVILIGPVPYYRPSLHALHPIHEGASPASLDARYDAAVQADWFGTDQRLAAFAATRADVDYVSTIARLCPDGPLSCRHVASDGRVVTMDASHYTPTATRDLLEELRSAGLLAPLSRPGASR